LLDLSKEEVAKWVEDEVIKVIREYKPDFFKIDFNRLNIGEEGQNINSGYIENSQWGHANTLYKIYDRLNTEFPELILENCSGGGGRNDLGMVKRCHTNCQSDVTSQPRNLVGLNGLTIAYPPELFKHYYPLTAEYSLYGNLDFQFRVMMLSNPIFIDLFEDNDNIKNDIFYIKFVKYLQLYKQFIRPMLSECVVYHHTPYLKMHQPNAFCILEYAVNDLSCAMILIFRLTEKADQRVFVKPKGLDPNSRYRVVFDNEEQSVVLDDIYIINNGIEVILENSLDSQMLLFKNENNDYEGVF
jgi:alpha-galactosidase